MAENLSNMAKFKVNNRVRIHNQATWPLNLNTTPVDSPNHSDLVQDGHFTQKEIKAQIRNMSYLRMSNN